MKMIIVIMITNSSIVNKPEAYWNNPWVSWSMFIKQRRGWICYYYKLCEMSFMSMTVVLHDISRNQDSDSKRNANWAYSWTKSQWFWTKCSMTSHKFVVHVDLDWFWICALFYIKLEPHSLNAWIPAAMMTSSNGSIFRVTGHFCGECTGPRWIPYTKAGDAELWCFLWSAPE